MNSNQLGQNSLDSNVDLAFEARATDTNSRYELLDLDHRNQKCGSWSKNKYIIIGILLISVLLAGSISFLIVYPNYQELEMEKNKYEEIAQADEAPYINSNHGVVIVNDPTNDASTTEKPKTTTHKMKPTTHKMETTTKESRTTESPSNTTDTGHGTTPDDADTTDSNNNGTSVPTSPPNAKDPVAFFNEQKDITAVFLFEECFGKIKKSKHGFKCTLVVETHPMSQRNFTGYGKSKNKAKKTAAETAALTLFNVTFVNTVEDLAEMEQYREPCENDLKLQ